MQQTKHTIYSMHDGFPVAMETTDLVEALQVAERFRKAPGYSAVCIASENSDQIGQLGVDNIVDGKTPDGHDYSWVKRRDGGQ